MTLTEPKRTSMRQANILAEIGLLIYPDCQLSAVHGLTDLMRIANRSTDALTDGLEEDAPARPEIRVSHWLADERGISCSWDSHPGLAHQLTHALAPPSIVMPDEMQPMPVASGWLKDCHRAGAVVGSVCAGAFVLAETGLLSGRRATTHWAFAERLAERYPQISVAGQNMVIDEGDIITAGGILAWADLGLVLVERLLGPGVMRATARFLLIDPPRRNQRLYEAFVPKLDHHDEQIRKSQQLIHARSGEALTVAELARHAAMSERTFLRRFRRATGFKPAEYLQHIRIMKARDALELSSQSVDQIAWTVGYSDAAAFRKVFSRITGMQPRQYRQCFTVAGPGA